MVKAWLPPPVAGNDINLMEFFMSQDLPINHLQHLNHCRVYLQVLHPSNITSVDGTRIMPPILTGQKLIDCHSSLTWPTQKCPSKSDWGIWAAALSPLCHG